MDSIELFRHQRQIIKYPFEYPDISYFFLIGGFGCGKTATDVFFILKLIELYWKYPVTIGVASVTLTLLKKTLIAELEKLFIQSGSEYRYNRQENVIRVGKMEIVLLSMDQPELIYAYNFSIFLGDEIDELPQHKSVATFIAAQERVRVELPDGRKPFSLFTTTAQGYKGTYQIIEELKEKKQRYVKVRGLTKDNTSLSPDYVKRLYDLYTENERLAFLEGHFVNLTTGRVYPEFTDGNLSESFQLQPNEVVHIGQDLNTGFSKAVAVVVRDRKLYVVKEFSFPAIGGAPKILRQAFPNQHLIWYPDASGKEIMAGYTREMQEVGIELRIGSVNPSIIDRIFFVNKLLSATRLMVDRMTKMLPMALRTRQYDKSGSPEKGQGEKAPDHVCFTGDTIITTNQGPKAIYYIRTGDMVLTRKGYKMVTAFQMTGFKETFEYKIAGKLLKCTEDHPIWTKNKKRVPAHSLMNSDTVYALTNKNEIVEKKVSSNTGFVQRKPLGVMDVYNLTVEGEHEYFANGILVSNCDALEYVTWRLVSSLPEFFDLWSLSRSYKQSKM